MTMDEPDFRGKGGWVNPDRLSPESRDRLFEALPKELQTAAGGAFVARLSVAVWECEEVWRNELPSDVIGRSQAVRMAINDLQNRIRSLSEIALTEFDGYYTGLMHQRDRHAFAQMLNNAATPPREVDGGEFLNAVWADLNRLSEVCELLSANTVASPHNQPSKAHAHRLARSAAAAWRHCFKQEPTANTKEESTPFTRLLKTLANRAAIGSPTPQVYPESGFVIGASIARNAIAATKAV